MYLAPHKRSPYYAIFYTPIATNNLILTFSFLTLMITSLIINYIT